MAREYGGSSECPTCEKYDAALTPHECQVCEKMLCQHCGPDHAENHAAEADEDPPCECIRIDVDLYDNSGCLAHGGGR